jgi:hypothetical protein
MNKKLLPRWFFYFCTFGALGLLASNPAFSAEKLIADTTPDFRASVAQGKSDAITYPAKDPARGNWSSGTMPDQTYEISKYTLFEKRSFNVPGFDVYGYTHLASGPLPWIGQDCGIPKVKTLQPAIRRWTSNFDGKIRISGEVGMDTSHQPLGGTGTRVSLYIDGVEKYTKDLVGTDGTQFKFDLPEQEIKKGTIVDFVISARDATSKIANFTGQIYEISANP